MSTTAFEYNGAKFVTNNYSAILDNDEAPKEFHLTQDFLAHTNYDDGGENGTPSLTCNYEGQEYAISPATIRKALHLPEEKKYDASLIFSYCFPDVPIPETGNELPFKITKRAFTDLIKKDSKKPQVPVFAIPVTVQDKLRAALPDKYSALFSDENAPQPSPSTVDPEPVPPSGPSQKGPVSEDPEQPLIPFSNHSAEPLLIQPISAMPLEEKTAADQQMSESTSDHTDQTEGTKSVEEKIAADTDISEKPSDAPGQSEDAQIEMVLQLIQDSLVQPDDIVAAPVQEIQMAETSQAATEALEFECFCSTAGPVEKKKEKLVIEAEKLIEAGDPESQKFCQTLTKRGNEQTAKAEVAAEK
nr:PREDICTED: uncharacterized protein LOC108207337 [Daucus carota subsp. sativus]